MSTFGAVDPLLKAALDEELKPRSTKCVKCNFIGPVRDVDSPDTPLAFIPIVDCKQTVSGKHYFVQPIVIQPYGALPVKSSYWQCVACNLVDDSSKFYNEHKSL